MRIETVPTMKVRRRGEEEAVIVNISDYDPATMVKVEEARPAAPVVEAAPASSGKRVKGGRG